MPQMRHINDAIYSSTALRGVGLVFDEKEGSACNIDTLEGPQASDNYQTISRTSNHLVWTLWKKPNPPPTGAIAVSVKPQKFLAADLNFTTVGYMDPLTALGSCFFPNQPKPSASCHVLTEVEPWRYELSDIQLKRNKGFIEEDIVLAYGKLAYDEQDPSGVDWDSSTNNNNKERKKGKVESILSYDTNGFDYWGQGEFLKCHIEQSNANLTLTVPHRVPYGKGTSHHHSSPRRTNKTD